MLTDDLILRPHFLENQEKAAETVYIVVENQEKAAETVHIVEFSRLILYSIETQAELIGGVVKFNAISDHLPYLCPTKLLCLATPLIIG